jgi:hypothetical protein
MELGSAVPEPPMRITNVILSEVRRRPNAVEGPRVFREVQNWFKIFRPRPEHDQMCE